MLVTLTAALLTLSAASTGTAGEVVLTSSDGDIEIAGRLVSFEDGAYLVETAIGRIAVSADTVTCAGAGCPERDLVPVLAGARIGADVSITTDGGRVQVSGRLLGFEHQTYEVETKLGSLLVEAAGTECAGPGCPREIRVPRGELGPRLREKLGE